MSILEMTGLRVKRGRREVLSGIDLAIDPGEVVALLGRNGAGKSTLLLAALGLLPKKSGTVKVTGLSSRAKGRRVRERAVLVPDRPDVPGWMSASSLCDYLAPQYPHWDAALAERALEEMGVPRTTRFNALSRGNATKAMLAAALAARPALLLLDEPFANLDPLSREELQRGLLSELAAGETAALIATHELESTARLSDRVAVLAGGRIAQDLPTEEALAQLGGATRLSRLLETDGSVTGAAA